jgi:hypothetical protein
MAGTSAEVWIVTSDGRDIVRADAIVLVRLDNSGRVTAQLHDEARVTVTLIDASTEANTPADFHRQLVRTIAELADSSGTQLIRPTREARTWRWVTEPV